MKKFYNLILLDESGSMDSIRTSALSAMNETVQTIKKVQKEKSEYEHSISFVTFNGSGVEGIKFVRFNVPAQAMDELTTNDYNPDECTPLYDAIGTSVEALQKLTKNDDVVLVTIITDGMENSSCNFTGEQIRALIDKQKEKGWTFTYMGANQDSKAVGGSIGIKNTMDFDASKKGIRKMCSFYRDSYMIFADKDEKYNSEDFFKDIEN